MPTRTARHRNARTAPRHEKNTIAAGSPDSILVSVAGKVSSRGIAPGRRTASAPLRAAAMCPILRPVGQSQA